MLLTAFGSFFCDLIPQLGCCRAAKVMHHVMLCGVLRAPLTFFDTTPTGRIIARFSKDIDVVDTTIPHQLSDLMYCLFEGMFDIFSKHPPPPLNTFPNFSTVTRCFLFLLVCSLLCSYVRYVTLEMSEYLK